MICYTIGVDLKKMEDAHLFKMERKIFISCHQEATLMIINSNSYHVMYCWKGLLLLSRKIIILYSE